MADWFARSFRRLMWNGRNQITRASSRRGRSSRAVLAHGPRQTSSQLKPTLGKSKSSSLPRVELNNITRYFWVVTLCAFLSGCATYRPASIPEAEPEAGSSEEGPSILEGDTVRLVLRSGKKVSGKVLWLTRDEIALGRRGNYGDDDLVIKFSETEYAEIRDQSDGQIERSWFVSLGVAALISAYVGLRSIDMN